MSWKRIARYLQRGERTVRRWASERSLPVHRMTAAPNGSVWADPEELDAWVAGQARAAAEPPQSAERPTANPEALEAWAQGRYLLNRLTGASMQRAVAWFDRAIALDPRFADAHGSRAEALQLQTIYAGAAPAEVMPEALAAITRAVALAPEVASVHASLGYMHYTYTRDWSAAEEAFQRALSLDARSTIAHQWFAEMLAVLGRFDEAMGHADEARRLEPLSLTVAASRGHVLWLARRFAELEPAMRWVIELEADYPVAWILLLQAQMANADLTGAQATVAAAGFNGDGARDFDVLGARVAAMAGDLKHVRRVLAGFEARREREFVSAFYLGACHLALGNTEAALDMLEAAADERVWHITMINEATEYDPLRDHPRFQALVRRLGFPRPRAA